MDQTLAPADWDGFAARKEESRRRGLMHGHGIGDYLAVTGFPANELGGIRVEPHGTVTIITGTLGVHVRLNSARQAYSAPFAERIASRVRRGSYAATGDDGAAG